LWRVAARGSAAVRRATYLAAALWCAARRRFDLVCTRDLGVASAVGRVPRALRPPLVYESHGVAAVVSASLDALLTAADAASPRKQRRLRARERHVWRMAEGYVTITHALADELTAQFGARDRLVVIPDGVRLTSDRVFIPPRAAGRPLVAYAGHLYPWKGVDILLRVLVEAPEISALIVGGHPREPDLDRTRQLARSLGVESRVEFTGFVPPAEVARQIARADVLVLPNAATAISARYTSPLKLFEYLAAGRPIVASDLPALREVLRDEENALLVAPGDPTAFAAAIGRLSNDRTLATRIARTAFEDAALYTWETRAARLEALFEDVIRAEQKGDPVS
jgi:glycosyltransferase involved in cell wall biosynthesis